MFQQSEKGLKAFYRIHLTIPCFCKWTSMVQRPLDT